MTDHGGNCSMSRSGNVWDNAAMASFFARTTRWEVLKACETSNDASADVFY